MQKPKKPLLFLERKTRKINISIRLILLIIPTVITIHLAYSDYSTFTENQKPKNIESKEEVLKNESLKKKIKI